MTDLSSSIWIFDDFLSAEEVAEYRSLVDDTHNQLLIAAILCDKKSVVESFWAKHGEQLGVVCGIERLTNHITVSRSTRNINWHYDRVYEGDTHKILLYLDDVAGTLFRTNGRVHKVEAYPGRAVIFDMRLEHAGEIIPAGSENKYTIGFRGVQRLDRKLKVSA